MVFRSFDDRRRPSFDLLFVGEHFFRENVDGEAIEWAVSRLEDAEGTHRLLIYVSDGAPVDDSTLASNPPDILWNHLKHVLAKVSQDTSIHLCAIGIKHAVSNLVPSAITLTSFNDVEAQVIPYLAAELSLALKSAHTTDASTASNGLQV